MLKKGDKLKRGVLLDPVILQEEMEEKMIETGLNKKELCKKLSLCQRTVDRILSGERVMPKTAKKLREAGFTTRVKKINIVQ